MFSLFFVKAKQITWTQNDQFPLNFHFNSNLPLILWNKYTISIFYPQYWRLIMHIYDTQNFYRKYKVMFLFHFFQIYYSIKREKMRYRLCIFTNFPIKLFSHHIFYKGDLFSNPQVKYLNETQLNRYHLRKDLLFNTNFQCRHLLNGNFGTNLCCFCLSF